MSINIYTAYELHVFHEEKRIPTFHELFNQFFQPEAKGQLISECLFDFFLIFQKTNEKFDKFLPRI